MIREVIDFIKNNKWYVLLVVLLLGLYFYQFHGDYPQIVKNGIILVAILVVYFLLLLY